MPWAILEECGQMESLGGEAQLGSSLQESLVDDFLWGAGVGPVSRLELVRVSTIWSKPLKEV